MREAAAQVLRANDVGGWTRPAPRLYPHQWSWDSAFIAIGLAHLDPGRALAELEHLLAAQWTDGRVPHMVFDPNVRDYAPGPELWSSSVSPAAPRDRATSGLIQPPMHAIALELILDAAPRDRVIADRARALVPKMLAWHRYLARERDPEASGLITVYHPWEGTDNTPRWDAALAALTPGVVEAYARHDIAVVDAAERPTTFEYDRYVHLVALLRERRYEDDAIRASHPFRIKDIQCSAIFAAACRSLERVVERLGIGDGRAEIAQWTRRASAGVQRQWNEELGLCCDLDLTTGAPITVRTSAALSAIVVPGLDRAIAERLAREMLGPHFAGATGLCVRAVPSTSPSESAFRSRAYWRGPLWPVVNWLLWWGLRAHGLDDAAAVLRDANLTLLARDGEAFAEYYEPFTGEPLGSAAQSWTAAVALDWLASS